MRTRTNAGGHLDDGEGERLFFNRDEVTAGARRRGNPLHGEFGLCQGQLGRTARLASESLVLMRVLAGIALRASTVHEVEALIITLLVLLRDKR